MRRACILFFALLFLIIHPAIIYAQPATCSTPFGTSVPALSDLSTSYTRTIGASAYGSLTLPPGIYPDNRSKRPAAHEQTGITIASALTPINGKIGFAAIGMSNTFSEFQTFLDLFATHPTIHSAVTFVNGALGSHAVQQWAEWDPDKNPWPNLETQVASVGLTKDQVQIIWLKLAAINPTQYETSPGNHITVLADGITSVIKKLPEKGYTNVKMMYLTSRTRSYREDPSLNPEPFAYESAFAVRDVINRQLNPSAYTPEQRLDLANSPYLSWGPYIYADGPNPRSDGLTWPATDLNTDCTHPSNAGKDKVARQLMNFFATDTTTTPWFLRTTSGGPSLTINTSILSTQPLRLRMVAQTTVPEVYWSFGDHTTVQGTDVQKTYTMTDAYTVSVSAFSSTGEATVVRIPPIPALPAQQGDTDGDGDVDLFDYTTLLGHFGQAACGYTVGDFDDNCIVDIFDYTRLLSNFGASP